MIVIRRAQPSDLQAVEAIQAASPEAAHWPPADYLAHDFFVALFEETLAGFVVTRALAPAESEILNLAVAPKFRRQGIARALLSHLFSRTNGAFFLEVRASNSAARNFYKCIGFQELSRRKEYYSSPLEDAIVMNFHSC